MKQEHDGRPTAGDQWSALALLARKLGWIEALRVGVRSSRTGGIFAHLEPPSDSRERASRQQAAPAFALYRALLKRMSEEEALSIVGAAVENGALRFLARQLHDLDPSSFAALAPEEREQRAEGWMHRFFTADAALEEITESRVEFTVRACALHRLAQEAGHPEVGPLFCRADAAFFAARHPPVLLERPETIAEGGSRCLFRLQLAKASDEALDQLEADRSEHQPENYQSHPHDR